MHELPFVQSIFEKTLSHAKKHHAIKVTTIHIQLGCDTGFVDDSIEFYWKHVAQGSIAEQAKIKIIRIPAEITCLSCQKHYITEDDLEICSACGSYRMKKNDTMQAMITSMTLSLP